MPIRLFSDDGIAQPDGSLKGNVEVYRDGFWGSVCAFDTGTLEAAVVCRQLGWQGWAAASTASSGAADRLVWINSTVCTGTEASLLDCTVQAVNASSCGTAGYAVVQCWPNGTLPCCMALRCRCLRCCLHRLCKPPFKILHWLPCSCIGAAKRTANDSLYISSDSGVVYLFRHGIWGGLCADDGFDGREAAVVARQLDLSGAAAAGYTTTLTQLSWIANVSCQGTESKLADCAYTNLTQRACAGGLATITFTPNEGGHTPVLWMLLCCMPSHGPQAPGPILRSS